MAPLLFSTITLAFLSDFYRASICEGSLGSHNSVCPSVRLSHMWIVTKLNDALWIFWYHRKGQSLWHQQWLVGYAPFLWNLHSKWPTPFEKRRLRPISAHNISTVGNSEKKFNYDAYKVDHGLSNEL